MAGIAGLSYELAELTLEEIEELEALDEEIYAENYEANVEDEFPELQFPNRRPFFRRPPLREVVQGAPAAGIVAEGIALPAQVRSYGKKWFGSKRAVSKMHRRINTGPRARTTGRAVPYFSLANSSRARTMALGKRKRTTLRGRKRRGIPRMVRPRRNYGIGRVSSSRLATGSSMKSSGIVVINKLFKGFAPTAYTPGQTLTDVMTNIGSRTTPDGSFSSCYHWTLANFPNYADYTDIYQWYKILFVKVHYYPLNNSYPGLHEGTATNPIEGLTATGGTNYVTCKAPSITYAKDDQVDTYFTTESIAMQHHGAQYHQFNDGNDLTIYVTPKPTGLLGTAGSEAVYQHPKPQWISTSESSVKHFGLRTFWQCVDGASVRVIMEMKVAFKEPKI